MQKQEQREAGQESKNKTIVIILLLLIIIIAICIIIWALFFRFDDVINPDYPPIDTEENQHPIDDDNGVDLNPPEGGGAVNLTYLADVRVDLSEEEATLMFANPDGSNQDMMLTLVIDDLIVLKTDRITPGNMVTELPLLEGVADRLSIGGYDAKFVVYLYDCETGERAIVTPEAQNIVVTVIE